VGPLPGETLNLPGTAQAATPVLPGDAAVAATSAVTLDKPAVPAEPLPAAPTAAALDSPRQPAPRPASRPLERIGRFQIRRFLGEGGFGQVYEAHDPQLDRRIALKIARPEQLRDSSRVEFFLREARAAANLRHPHIVAVFDSGKDGAHYYIASAFIDGQSLDKRLHELPEGQTLPFRQSVDVVRRVAEALAYAHSRGVIHRDVKPANIMCDEQSLPLLMDFGLAARLVEGEEKPAAASAPRGGRAAGHGDARLHRPRAVPGPGRGAKRPVQPGLCPL
jgi:serine/threonine protein kinase